MPQPSYTLTFTDYEGSKGTMDVNTGIVTALTLPALLTQVGALRTATAALVRGVIANEQQDVFNTILSQALPTDQDAQRGNKWLVSYHDNTQFFDPPVNAIPNDAYLRKFRVMIPTANNSLLADNENDLDITAGAGLAFKTAFEAVAKSPAGGTVVIDFIRQTNVNA
jgi:type II secretory pathway pseudopilin PulG